MLAIIQRTAVTSSRSLAEKMISLKQGDKVFAMALIFGVGLRLISAAMGDIDPGGDGMGRMAFAVDWAERPRWQGLTGLWPPLHWYFLGSLILLWNQPIILAKTINFICGVCSVWVFRSAVRKGFGESIANLSALLLAINWTHIWLTSSYWVEIPYLFLIFLATFFSLKARKSRSVKDALFSGGFLCCAILLRHEAMLILGLFLLWYLIRLRKAPLLLGFALIPLCAAAWNFIEPWMNGKSYFDYSLIVTTMKAGENTALGVTLLDSLKQWVIMPAAVPSVFVVLPGIYGLWRLRSKAFTTDLFAWMFISQTVLYAAMTLFFNWRPQLRYVMLWFVNLLPYAGQGWLDISRRYSLKRVLPVLVIATLLSQSILWWAGRNHWMPGGWLPLRVANPSQEALDEWANINRNRLPYKKIVSLVGSSSFTEPWSLTHSLLVNRILSPSIKYEEVNVGYKLEILRGEIPPEVHQADVVILDPTTDYYSAARNNLESKSPSWTAAQLSEHVIVLSKP
jgi:hypothetical protein